MAAGLATLHVMEDEQVVANARRIGDLFQQRLSVLKPKSTRCWPTSAAGG